MTVAAVRLSCPDQARRESQRQAARRTYLGARDDQRISRRSSFLRIRWTLAAGDLPNSGPEQQAPEPTAIGPPPVNIGHRVLRHTGPNLEFLASCGWAGRL